MTTAILVQMMQPFFHRGENFLKEVRNDIFMTSLSKRFFQMDSSAMKGTKKFVVSAGSWQLRTEKILRPIKLLEHFWLIVWDATTKFNKLCLIHYLFCFNCFFYYRIDNFLNLHVWFFIRIKLVSKQPKN